MLREANLAKDYLIKKFGTVEKIEPGIYAVPIETSKGDSFMKIQISDSMGMSGFELFKDEELKNSWYD